MPSPRSLIMPRLAALFVSDGLRDLRRGRAERARRGAGAPHHVRFFCQVDDPSSALLSQALGRLVETYGVTLEIVPVPPPPDWAAPERARLDAWALADAKALAVRHALDFPPNAVRPRPDLIAAATPVLTRMARAPLDPPRLAALLGAVWAGDGAAVAASARDAGADTPDAAADALAAGDALRTRLGHYLGGMLHYAGEWYWGIDRLHHLEDRLRGLGLGGGTGSPLFPPPEPATTVEPSGGTLPALEFFFSFRSPYSYLAADRTIALAARRGVDLRLRFVLPMVMRGLPVPPAKRRYIVLDCKREATRLGLPFGRICDPVGAPVERGLSLVPLAVRRGRGADYVRVVLSGVFARGIDIGSDAGLKRLVVEAGLDWDEARTALRDDAWRIEAEQNRAAMLEAGLWGVPAFRFGDRCTWGQDRLWLVDRWIAQAQADTGSKEPMR